MRSRCTLPQLPASSRLRSMPAGRSQQGQQGVQVQVQVQQQTAGGKWQVAGGRQRAGPWSVRLHMYSVHTIQTMWTRVWGGVDCARLGWEHCILVLRCAAAVDAGQPCPAVEGPDEKKRAQQREAERARDGTKRASRVSYLEVASASSPRGHPWACGPRPCPHALDHPAQRQTNAPKCRSHDVHEGGSCPGWEVVCTVGGGVWARFIRLFACPRTSTRRLQGSPGGGLP